MKKSTMKTANKRQPRPAMRRALFVMSLFFFFSCGAGGGTKIGTKPEAKIDSSAIDKITKCVDPKGGTIICALPAIDDPSPQPKAVVDPTKVYSMSEVQVLPAFPGGMAKFSDYLTRNMDDITPSSGEFRMQFGFVVERDGRLTGVQIVDDGGDPTVAARAANVLTKSPKWYPGVLNGRAVRTAMIYPINIRNK